MEYVVDYSKYITDDCYYYRANVIEVYDGDTVTVNIDLGFGVKFEKMKIRLFGINSPERRDPDPVIKAQANKSREFMSSHVLGKDVKLYTIKKRKKSKKHEDKKGKYGRFLGIIYTNDINGKYINMNKLMVDSGHAKYKKY